MDKLQCLLCRQPYRQPKMCSHCSEIFCSRCINEYLEEHHLCPKCRQILPEMADCTRLIAQVKQHVRKARPALKQCKWHKLSLKYYCLDCQQLICSDCGIIDPKHKGHTIQPKDDSSTVLPKTKLRQYLLTVEESILRDHGRQQQLVLEREVLRSQVRWCRNRLHQFYQQMGERLEKEADKMMNQICSDLEEKETRLIRLRKMKSDINEILALGEVSDETLLDRLSPDNGIIQLLENSDQVLPKFDNLLEEYKEDTYFHFSRKSLSTLNEVYPEYSNQTYQLDYNAHRGSEVQYSETFNLYGQEWRLKIYPQGNHEAPGHLSLFLQMLDAPPGGPQCLEYYFRLELISLNTAGKTISKEYRSPFMPGDCWGYHDFLPLQELEEYLNNGHLIFVVGIRHCSYYDVSQTMNRYIRKLEEEKKVLEELMVHNHTDSRNLGQEYLSVDSRTSRTLAQGVT